ncbi:MAG: hypothetical protein JWP57_4460 [Spirosoma sp.]|nr:hypothetical protein [Spirosoma sp.]
MRALDFVVGHAVFVPDADSPEARELAAMLGSDGLFRVEAITEATSGAWDLVQGLRFTNWFQAARHALLLEEQGDRVRMVAH